MSQQDAGLLAIDRGVLQNLLQSLRFDRLAVMHADDLQAFDRDFFVVKHPQTRARDGGDKLGAVGEFLVIAGDEINTRWRGQRAEWFDQPVVVRLRTVKYIAADKHGV